MPTSLLQVTRRTALVGAAGAVLAGCARPNDPAGSPGSGTGSDSARPTGENSPTPTGPVETPITTIGSAHGLTAMWPNEPVDIVVEHGTIAQVTVTDAAGVVVPGSVTGSQWRPDRGALFVRSAYQMEVIVNDSAGQPHPSSASITTISPAMVTEVDFRYADGHPVGNGMPVWVRFDLPLREEQRAAIEKAATVVTTPPQEGSWGWADETTLYWRPRNYWVAGSTAHVEVKAAGLPANDTWVLADAAADYIFGDLRVLQANIDTHTLTCLRNGEVAQILAVSMGKPGYETMTGTKVIMDKQAQVIMDSETYGVPHSAAEGYRIVANYAQRLTWSGEYFHAAPWADYAHGADNVSHGCTGLSDADAVWLFNFTEIGDPAEFSGSTFPVKPWQTIGCWTYTWEQWQAQSALR